MGRGRRSLWMRWWTMGAWRICCAWPCQVRRPSPARSAFIARSWFRREDVDVVEKLHLNGAFTVGQAHFSKLNVQEKVNELSHRGSGDPRRAETDTVASGFRGNFKLDQGVMTLRNLAFQVPGVTVALNGTYGLEDRKMDMHGTASLQAKLSQTTTGIKSFFLKALDPFFEKKNAGAVIPIHIGGTSEHPSFGLGKGSAKNTGE